MQVVQTELIRHNMHLVCWLPVDARVRVGSVISLDKEDGRWKVLKMYGRQDHTDIQRGWNNYIVR